MARLEDLIKECCSDESKYVKQNNPVFKEIGVKLKPCPFCGGNVSLRHSDSQFGYTSNGYIINCPACSIGFSTKTHNWFMHLSEKDRAKYMRKIIKRWNKRAK